MDHFKIDIIDENINLLNKSVFKLDNKHATNKISILEDDKKQPCISDTVKLMQKLLTEEKNHTGINTNKIKNSDSDYFIRTPQI